MLWLISLLACSPEFTDITDSSDSFTPVTSFFGGPYLVFFNIEIDCKEMYWVTNIYRAGEAPYDRNLEAIQITYNDTDVATGIFSTGGEAPIRATHLTITGDAFEFENAADGSTIETTAVDEEWAAGEINLSFLNDRTVTGEYNIPFCTNLVQ